MQPICTGVYISISCSILFNYKDERRLALGTIGCKMNLYFVRSRFILYQDSLHITPTCSWWQITMHILGRSIFARLLFLRFWGPKKGPFFVILFCSNFHGLEALEAWLEACLEACPDVFCSNFHGLATLELKTCIEACLQLCFILQFFWLAAISITLRSRALPWGRPFAPAAA